MKLDLSYTLDALPRLLDGSLVTLKLELFGFAFSVVLATIVTIAVSYTHLTLPTILLV